ncbi:MAG: CocE/NonD family hydrolase [Chloroflexota bacterium]|nr:CocE/NonD family hydrolase [Chloroflexota bacterium]
MAYAARRHIIARWLRLPPARFAVGIERGVRVMMPDGVALVADHYYPKARGAFPTILIRTPYGRDLRGTTLGILHMFASQRFAERGYHVIVQDVRGRFDSEGTWEPFVDESRDGRATLEWIARQSWFDGNLGMWGPSYEGYVQWAVAPDAPAYLKAILPNITGSQINPYTGSAFGLDGILRWLDNLNPPGSTMERLRASLERLVDPKAQARALAPAFRHLPIGEADRLAVGRAIPYYRKWLAKENARTDAPFWKSTYHGGEMARVHAATHFVSGWYDILLHQLLKDYEAMRAAGHSPYLTVGPWRHLDIVCAEEALRAGIHWFDANLKGIAARLATELPASDSRADHYRYDPADPTPAFGGPVYHQDGGVKDNRALEARADVLTYTTPPLENDVDVIGWVRLELFARSSLAHTDFFARLCDVQPDGRSLNVCDGLFRVEPGNAELQPDGSTRVVIDMWATAQRFLRGHRIRLQVSSGAHPRWNRNLGTGEPIATATRMRAADQTIYHDAAHPSALVLPIAGAAAFDG